MKVNGRKIPSPVIRLVKHLLFTGKKYSEIITIVKKQMAFDISVVDIQEIEDMKGGKK